ncbi:MAG TPA: regulatory protein RecX [Clostridiales bacterium]|nr:regulatory protein RecX [Clostridiales bacterium]
MMDINHAYNYCIKLLSIKDRTTAELRKKLKEKMFPDDIIGETLNKLTDYGYINDERFTENWIKSKANQSGISKKYMYNKLLQKGIEKELIDNVFKKINIDDYVSAFIFAQKKIKLLNDDDKTKKNKLFTILARKGYNIELCKKVIKDIFESDDSYQ